MIRTAVALAGLVDADYLFAVDFGKGVSATE